MLLFYALFNFKKLTLRELNFNGAELNDCDFRDTIWEDCSMREAVIRQCRFKGADLRGCDLGGLTFSEAANLKGAYISIAQASDILAALAITVLLGFTLSFFKLPLGNQAKSVYSGGVLSALGRRAFNYVILKKE